MIGLRGRGEPSLDKAGEGNASDLDLSPPGCPGDGVLVAVGSEIGVDLICSVG